MKYRKKPVVIEAIQYDGKNSADIHEFCGDKVREPVGKDYLEIETLNGTEIYSVLTMVCINSAIDPVKKLLYVHYMQDQTSTTR